MKDEVKWIQGNCLESLKKLEDKSINCCVTSPPYWGLRDYGTGSWEGGDPDCPHKRVISDEQIKKISTGHKSMLEQGESLGDNIFKDSCKMCGAKRVDNQLGLEESPDDFVENLVQVFREVRRVLRDDGTLWLNLGDTYSSHKDCNSTEQTITKGTNYAKAHVLERSVSRDTKKLKLAGLKHKDLIGIPWRVALALQQDGWYLRQDIIWHKPNPMPESVQDRCTKSHEYIFLLTKKKHYYYDYISIKEKAIGERWGGNKPINMDNTKDTNNEFSGLTRPRNMIYADRNKRSVWSVPTKSFKGAHFATFPIDLITPCVVAGCPEKICVECDTPYIKEPIYGKMVHSVEYWEESLLFLDEGSEDFDEIQKVLSKVGDEDDSVEAEVITGYKTVKGCECKTDDFKKGTVLDTFGGAGTTGLVARNNNRNAILLELNPEYIEIAKERIYPDDQLF